MSGDADTFVLAVAALSVEMPPLSRDVLGPRSAVLKHRGQDRANNASGDDKDGH
jgi:hypothetical protein